jgi:hypothetical protein
VGLLITAVASARYVATWEVIYYRLAPDFGDKYAAYSVEKARRSGATDAQIAVRVKEMAEYAGGASGTAGVNTEMYRNPLVNVALTFLEPLPVGLLFTLVAAGVLSRKRRAQGTATV